MEELRDDYEKKWSEEKKASSELRQELSLSKEYNELLTRERDGAREALIASNAKLCTAIEQNEELRRIVNNFGEGVSLLKKKLAGVVSFYDGLPQEVKVSAYVVLSFLIQLAVQELSGREFNSGLGTGIVNILLVFLKESKKRLDARK